MEWMPSVHGTCWFPGYDIILCNQGRVGWVSRSVAEPWPRPAIPPMAKLWPAHNPPPRSPVPDPLPGTVCNLVLFAGIADNSDFSDSGVASSHVGARFRDPPPRQTPASTWADLCFHVADLD